MLARQPTKQHATDVFPTGTDTVSFYVAQQDSVQGSNSVLEYRELLTA